MKHQGIMSISCLADVSTQAGLILRVQHTEGKVSLCLPTSLDSLCLTLCTLLCNFWLPVPVNDFKVRAEGRWLALFVITERLEF